MNSMAFWQAAKLQLTPPIPVMLRLKITEFLLYPLTTFCHCKFDLPGLVRPLKGRKKDNILFEQIYHPPVFDILFLSTFLFFIKKLHLKTHRWFSSRHSKWAPGQGPFQHKARCTVLTHRQINGFLKVGHISVQNTSTYTTTYRMSVWIHFPRSIR